MSDSDPAPVRPLPPPPTALLGGAALFLDFDGTLAPIADTPDAVVIGEDLIDTLCRLRDRLDGRIAIISGRSVATLRDLGFADFLLAGSHGLELARPGEDARAAPRLPGVDAAQARLDAFVADRPGTLVERKTLSVGLHFRGAPACADEATALAERLAAENGLIVQYGKMLVELRPGGADKGSALRTLMAHPPMAGGVPLFIGDDVTDEEGFAAATELGGHGILVGEPRHTFATFRLEQVAAVRHYLLTGSADTA